MVITENSISLAFDKLVTPMKAFKIIPTLVTNLFCTPKPATPQVNSAPLPRVLGEQPSNKIGKKTLVLDLDETLVHSSFLPIPNPDFQVTIELEGHLQTVYVVKRPGVDRFLDAVKDSYEVVIFTASIGKYADPVLDILDKNKAADWRLFRESCTVVNGRYIKDLTRLGRDLTNITIVDNSPVSYMMQPSNAIPIMSFFDDPEDTCLLELLPVLEQLATANDDVPSALTRLLHKSTPITRSVSLL